VSGADTGLSATSETGAGFTAPETGVPHNEQNFLPGLSSPPQFLHKRGAAHLGQNFFSCATSAPQL